MPLSLLGQLIGIGLSVALGTLFSTVVAGARSREAQFIARYAGWGLGLGLSSLIWFVVWCRRTSGSPLVPASIEFLALLALIRLAPDRNSQPAPGEQLRKAKWPVIVVAVPFGCAAFYFIRFIYRAPYAGWDAWAIWNLHAHAFFVAGGTIWKAQLARIPWSHPDYPLLLPLNVARLWYFAGSEAPSAPAILAFLYTFGAALLLGGAIAHLKNRVSALLAMATLLALKPYLWIGLLEYADIPQSFYILSAFVTLAFQEYTGNRRFLILTGLSSGLAMWNKNEGGLFLLCLISAHFLLVSRKDKLRSIAGNALHFAVGAICPVFVTIIYKRRNPAPSDVLSASLTKSGVIRALDLHRLSYILENFGRILWNLDKWVVNPIVVLIVYVALVGFDHNNAVSNTTRTAVLTIGFVLLGYMCVYATSGSDLNWYINSSLDRLYTQLWPSFVFAVFLMTPTPRLRFSRAATRKEVTTS